ncbi:DUF441 domain-containing protein [Clostridium sp. 19966]|uniref:DUF441 domain-containing protein n=1 Tax=Clostridium sp. 19966 TaxID=2768166 RepID=UPI0028E01A90|nr:DUF441 domain-containing protein [Clostridium sp. 19966]MDT8717987.1 DUF441 domain-containing protein [Clostridium sp. 19966]
METNIILLIILAASIFGKADSVAIATSILLILKLLHVENIVFPILDKSGMFWGLVLLIMAIMIPIANGSIKALSIKSTLTSSIGIAAILLSFFTTYLSGLGLRYLTLQGHGDVMPALILGAVAAAAFLGGVPVGPLITSGLLALVMKFFNKS